MYRAPRVIDGDLRLQRELPRRVVVIGDLNGQGNLLVRMLRGLRLLTRDNHWCGGKTLLVQLGDIPNRGPTPRMAMELMVTLRAEAQEAGGDVVWLLGNHEVLSALGHEAYVTADEYLEFATEDELELFYHDRSRFQFQFLGAHRPDGMVPPMGGPLRAWEEENAPGREAYRRAMGPHGILGRAIRALPIAVQVGPLLFVHGGLTPRWAERGVDALTSLARAAWAEQPAAYDALEAHSILRDPLGPLWNRVYCLASAARVGGDLQEALRVTGTERMIVGHTRTDAAPGGVLGRPLVRHGGRLIMSDVGLGEPGDAGSALVIERGRIEVWSPGGGRSKLLDVAPHKARRRRRA